MTSTAQPAAATHDPPVAATAAGYRPYLDGLRAVAVYLVVLFHAGTKRFTGGFVGVDVFFVLSGFLVTQLLLRDLAGNGGIRFSRFYSRRFRRLLPAAFAVLIITAAVYAAIKSPTEALAQVDAFRAAFLYSANWFFIHDSTGYFGANVASNPVLQFWSLAVEEQFYLLWPLLLGALFWITTRWPKRQMVLIRVAVAGAAVASLVWALSLRTTNPDRAYYGTDARAYQLLAGALIALTPELLRSLARFRRAMRTTTILSVGALLVLASSALGVNPIVRGALVTLVAVAVIVSLEQSTGGPVSAVLSSDPFVYLGKISYGTYLWHWPVILVTLSLWRLGSLAMIGVVCLVTTGLASLSYQVLERPVREARFLDRHRAAVIASGLAISIVSAWILVPRILDPAPTSSAVAPVSETSGLTPVPAGLDFRRTYLEGFGQAKSCVDAPPSQCTVVHGKGRHVLLMGDSNAQMMIPAFTKIAKEQDLTLSLAVTEGCRWQRDLYYWTKPVQDTCRKNKTDAYDRVIPALKPDLIVLVNAPEDSQTNPLQPDSRPDPELLRRTTTDSLRALAAPGRDILIIEPMPQPADNTNPLDCIARAKTLEACRYVVPTAPTTLESLERKLADQSDQIWSANFDRLVCPFLPICDPVVNGTIVKWDGAHLTKRFSESLAGDITAYLKDNGLIDR